MNALFIARNLPAIIAGSFLLFGLLAGGGITFARLTRYRTAYQAGFAAGAAWQQRQQPAQPSAPARADGRPQPQRTYRPARVNPTVADAPTQRLDMDSTAQLPPVTTTGRPQPGRGWRP